MVAMVGYTGFVGSNLYAQAKTEIQAVYNSKNIGEAFGARPDLLIYAGLRAEKYLANTAPEKDREMVAQAEENIRRIQPQNVVLISTIDVFRNPKNVNEETLVNTEGLQPYGLHRYQLEKWLREHCPQALIVRLPGLFGENLKKNFIYDYIHVIPFRLKAQKLEELSLIEPDLQNYYDLKDDGFYQCRELNGVEQELLKKKFKALGFSALCFTDSRSRYQFYPLKRLWGDIQTALKSGITLWHPATEPVSAGELYQYLTGEAFVNELGGKPADYDYRTVHDRLFGGANGYIEEKSRVLREIRQFVDRSLENA